MRSFLVLLAASALYAQRPEHPRPDFERPQWMTLNGPWEFGFTEKLGSKITVPFCWESELSGAHKTGETVGWYKKTFRIPASWTGKHAWLHFDAVDEEAHIWLNGQDLGTHHGGYSPFEFDLNKVAKPGDTATVIVRAQDLTDQELPVGKQTPSWYTYTSGIWQTVWLEARPEHYIKSFTLTPWRDGEKWFVEVDADLGGGSRKLQADPSPIVKGPGINTSMIRFNTGDASDHWHTSIQVENPQLWTPDSPHLYDIVLQAGDDRVKTYFGLRTISRGKFAKLDHESIFLNGQPVYWRGALDQSFNPKGIYTAPSDEFLKHDMELAKAAGIQFLRIHIKADEPRRLYWADKLGMLIMQDMPSASFQNPAKRSAWEETMRSTIARDRNHPSIFAWVAFNETWGLSYFRNSQPPYPQNPDTQQWVESVFHEMKQLDPSRLVEDNSADKRDHVASDINSWHFYIDNYERAKALIDDVVSKTFPGSEFNFVRGRKQETAPLINSEYGAVGAGNGDRDVSWGFHFLTNELRVHEKIQGYIYTELSDIEWEHNGFYNYDRSAKDFGYDAFVPGMTTRDLQGEDFIGYDGPPIVKATAFTLPVFVSHFSARTDPPTLRWWLTGTDDFGVPVTTPPQTQPVKWERARVNRDIHLDVRVPGSRPFTGALSMELLDSSGKRIAANFVNVATRTAMSPRIEIVNPRTVALRFSPIEVREQGPDSGIHPGKFWASNQAYVAYRVTLPDWLLAAGPEQIDFLAEMGTHAGTAKLDWPWRQKAVDYPQTDVHKYPGKARIKISGVDAGEVTLADDPADIRGFLSSAANFHHASYGYLTRVTLPAPQGATDLTIRIEATKGISIYGEGMGRYGFDPVVIVHTGQDVRASKN
jgi:Glycosyl hydrolases family 2, sugar binding domain/Glycosyl hydrolases family 2, TIM barrel domain/Glycosyl hydrolases family 2